MKPYLPHQFPKFLDYTERGLFIKSSISGLIHEEEALVTPKKSEPKIHFNQGEISIKYNINKVTLIGSHKILYYTDHDTVRIKVFDKKDFIDGHFKPELEEKLGLGHFSQLQDYKLRIHCYICDSAGNVLGRTTNLLEINEDLFVSIQDDLMSSMQ